MIKLIREGSRKYPWILITLMLMIVVAFIVGMGWWGYGEARTDKVAQVGELSVTIEEYRRTYRNLYDYYKENIGDDVKDDEVKQTALETLIQTKLWVQGAERLGLTVTPAELRAKVIGEPAFHKNGRFHPDVYRTVLLRNRLTPSLFEALERERLLADKARLLVASSVALTPDERREAEILVGTVSGAGSSTPIAKDLLMQNFMFQKQQRALNAYTEALKTKVPVEIYRENM